MASPPAEVTHASFGPNAYQGACRRIGVCAIVGGPQGDWSSVTCLDCLLYIVGAYAPNSPSGILARQRLTELRTAGIDVEAWLET